MTLENIFNDIASRMIKGLMFHDQLAQVFLFLGMPKYEKAQYDQYREESDRYHDVCHFYGTRSNKLLRAASVGNVEIIPSNWYDYTRMDMSFPTRKQTIKEMFEKWIAWEEETKRLFEVSYCELIELHEVAYADRVLMYIQSADEEIERVRRDYLEMKSTDFDMPSIVSK